MGKGDFMKSFRSRQEPEEQAHPAAGHSSAGVSQLIRIAEKYMASGRYALALEQLAMAHELDPGNQYIDAVTERAKVLSDTERRNVPPPRGIRASAGTDAGRYLSVTVGKQFERGIKAVEEEIPMNSEELQRRVHELTDTAQILLNRGLSESAFETLMKAYLLDPLNPEVLSCEQRVLPAWENFRRQRKIAPPIASPFVSSPPDSQSDLRRLEVLKRQRELEQLERERALWRKASSPSSSIPPGGAKSAAAPASPSSKAKKDDHSGFFKALRKRH
jgi:tetratricopeptide (TPR) repeat protein